MERDHAMLMLVVAHYGISFCELSHCVGGIVPYVLFAKEWISPYVRIQGKAIVPSEKKK